MKRRHNLDEYRESVRRQIMDDFAFAQGSFSYLLIAHPIQEGTIEELVDFTAQTRKAEDDANGGREECDMR